jgi:methyl-accepting chemotaxis protein
MASSVNQNNNTPGTGSRLLSSLHYVAAIGAVLMCADMLSTNVLRLSGTTELTRQLTEFSSIPANYKFINTETLKSTAEGIRNFAGGNVLISQAAVIFLLGINVALIGLHFFSRRRLSGHVAQPAAAAAAAAETFDMRAVSGSNRAVPGNYLSQLKAIALNLKSMVTGARRQAPGSRLSTAMMERIVHLNLDIETAAKIIKSLENNLTESATQLQVLAKAAMESGNRAVNTNIEWNKLTKMLEKQNHLNLSAQTGLKNIRRVVKDIARLTQDAKQTEQGVTTRFRNIESGVLDLYERSEEGDRLVQDMHTNINTCISDVRTASELVKQLSGKARDIVNIISVIDDIAEQTNLLALNASIEAARAGEQGQGFAVVADEVRKLAVRSSSTTRNITHLLQTIQSEAESAAGYLSRGEDSITHTSSLFGRFGQHVALDRNSITRCLEEVGSNQLLIRRLNESFAELGKHCASMDDYAGELVKHQEGIFSQADSWQQEIRNSAIATDRIARNLTRNHFKLEHLERLAISNVETTRDVHKLVAQNIGFSGILRGSISGSETNLRNTTSFGEATHFVEMLEATVNRMTQAYAADDSRRNAKQDPVVGEMPTNLHPYEKTVFADIKQKEEKGA